MRSSRRLMPLRVTIAAVAVALLAGCGGSKENSKRGPVAQPAPVQQVVQQPVAQVSPKPQIKPNAAPAEPKSPFLDPSINPHDVYDVVAEGPAFDVIRDGGTALSADSFVVIVPPKGTDSSQYQYNRSDTEAPDARVLPTVAAPERKMTKSSRGSEGRTKADKKAGSGKIDSGKTGARRSADKKNGRSKTGGEAANRTESRDGSKLPAGFTPIASAGQSRIGLPARIRCDHDGTEMALVTGGAVVVGHDGGPADSSPQITVVLDSFYMDITEVTLAKYLQFREIMKEEKGRNIVPEPENASSAPAFPVLGVTWLQAGFYARWAGKDLPTEAEWERAARGEAGFDHPWGNGRPIWKQARQPSDIGPVKSHRTDLSPFGIYDLAGNAREWCLDRYSATAFAEALHASPKQLRNWKGPRLAKPDNYHVVKGDGPDWKAWYREGLNASKGHKDVGFRCVLRLNASSP